MKREGKRLLEAPVLKFADVVTDKIAERFPDWSEADREWIRLEVFMEHLRLLKTLLCGSKHT